MKLTKLFLLPVAGLTLAFTVNATVGSGAGSASHRMEDASAEIHEYLHVAGYPSSYGSHGLETDSTTIHSRLHDYSNGLATEAEVAADWARLEDTYKAYKQMVHQAQVLNAGDDELDALFEETKEAYKALRFELRNVQG